MDNRLAEQNSPPNDSPDFWTLVGPDLIEALTDENAGVRVAALAAVRSIGDTSAIPTLIELLQDTTSGLRSQAVSGIRDIAGPDLDLWHDAANSPLFAALVNALIDTRTLTEDHRVYSPWNPECDPDYCNMQNRRRPEQSIRNGIAEILARFGPAAMAPLAEALHHEYDIIRFAGAVGLGATGDAGAIPALVKALADLPYVAGAAVAALGKIGTPAVPCLVELLTDPRFNDARVKVPPSPDRPNSSSLRGHAAMNLGTIGDHRAVPALVAALGDPDLNMRRDAADALGDIKPPAAPPELIAALSTEHWIGDHTWFKYPYRPGRHHIAEALGKIGDAAAAGPLIEAMGDRRFYHQACRALGEIGDASAVPALVDGLSDVDRRSTAARALGKIHDPAVIPALEKSLREYDGTGLSPAEILAEIGPRAFPVLLEALRDDNPTVRLTVAQWLVHPNLAPVIPEAMLALADALEDEDELVRKSAATGLHKIGNRDVVPALVAALGRTCSQRSFVAKALGKVGDAAALPALISALSDEDISVRYWAVRAIGWIRPEEVPAAALMALTDDDAQMRRTTAVALGELGREAAIPGLIRALDDEDEKVCHKAAMALGDIGDPSAIPALLGTVCPVRSRPRSPNTDLERTLLDRPLVVEVRLRFSSTYLENIGYTAASAIGVIGGAAAVDGLAVLFADPDDRVRFWAAVGLGKTRHLAAIPHLQRALKDPCFDVRNAGAVGLTRIVDKLRPKSTVARVPRVYPY
ncbi:MAG: HEAT repeat domain-containing protein [Capsulimonadaceae bacterium]